MNKISVIVPIYKVENYLDRCLDSLVNQTYKNLEIILVDDGSPDNCPKMCDEWAKKDKRIKVIHKENGGLSSARNTGLDNSTGKYIAFVDSDDWIDETMYEKLVTSLEKNKSDISMCGINYAYDDKVLSLKEINLKKAETGSIYSYIVKSGKRQKNNEIFTDNIMCAVWRCLYKKELIQGTLFEKDMFCEDVIFTLNILKKQPKISVVDENLYNYYQREGSILHYYSEKKLNARKKFIQFSLELLSNLVATSELAYYKYLQYELAFNEVALSGDKALRKKFLRDDFLQSLNTKQNYTEKKKQTTLFKYKIADFLTRHKMFFVYSKLVKFR